MILTNNKSNQAIDFQSMNCKNTERLRCHSRWQGFGFEFICNCSCHKKQAALERVEGPISRATRVSLPFDRMNANG
jgi:hypothetical protein